MSKSAYISKNLTPTHTEMMRLLEDYEMEIFSLEDVKKLAKNSAYDVNEVLENLVHKKVLSRIERGKFCKTNFRDEKAIGCFLVPDGVVAYWSALNIHQLTEQFPNTVFIQTTHLKKNKTVFGTSYQFIKIKKSKRTGIVHQGFGNYKYNITDIEKTIVDCFDLMQYSGGYAELIRAFYSATLNQNKLIEYCQAVDNISVIKRMAFLAELLQKNKMSRFIKFAHSVVNARYVLFDPYGEDKGSFNSKWKLRLNMTENEILNICNKQY